MLSEDDEGKTVVIERNGWMLFGDKESFLCGSWVCVRRRLQGVDVEGPSSTVESSSPASTFTGRRFGGVHPIFGEAATETLLRAVTVLFPLSLRLRRNRDGHSWSISKNFPFNLRLAGRGTFDKHAILPNVVVLFGCHVDPQSYGFVSCRSWEALVLSLVVDDATFRFFFPPLTLLFDGAMLNYSSRATAGQAKSVSIEQTQQCVISLLCSRQAQKSAVTFVVVDVLDSDERSSLVPKFIMVVLLYRNCNAFLPLYLLPRQRAVLYISRAWTVSM